MNPAIAIINEANDVPKELLAAICAAIQVQVSRDFAPAWGIDAEIIQCDEAEDAPIGAWWIVLGHSSEELTALGYHDLTTEGLPLGKVAPDNSLCLSIVLSREVLSLLVDPDISTTTTYQSATRLMHIAREVCDPCAGIGYVVDNVAVADFVYPAWFQDFNFGRAPLIGDPLAPCAECIRNDSHKERHTAASPALVRFDHMGQIIGPFQFLDGGYISVFDQATGGWRDIININMDPPREPSARASVGSRRERRRTPRAQWRKSKGELKPVDAEVGMREIFGQ